MCISLQIDNNMALLVLCGVHVAENENYKVLLCATVFFIYLLIVLLLRVLIAGNLEDMFLQHFN